MKRISPILKASSGYLFPLLVLLSGILVYKNIIFSTGPAFQVIEMKDMIFPKYYFIRKAFITGEFPFWDPYTMLGQPCIFGTKAGVSYLLLLAFLSMKFFGTLLPREIELLLVAHLLLSGLTMYWGARKLGLGRLGACLAGIVFQMAIINKYIIQWNQHALGLPWVPLAISFGIVLFRSKEPVLAKRNFPLLLITILSLCLLMSIASPYFVLYTFLTLGIAAIFYIFYRIKEKDWFGVRRILNKSIYVFTVSLFLTAFITIPCYAVWRDSIRYNIGVLIKYSTFHFVHIWTLLFPGFINIEYLSQPIAYTGVVTLILVFYFCITKRRNDKNKSTVCTQELGEGFLFVILAVFWFFYAIDGSPLEKIMSYLPVLKDMRWAQFGLVIYVYAISILAGKGIERISKSKDCKIGLNINWLFPIFIISMLIYSMPSLIHMLNQGNSVSNYIALLFGCIFILYLLLQQFIKSNKLKVVFSSIIPFAIILEIFITSPHFMYRSEHEEFFPYDYNLKKYEADFPECFLNKDLYRFESFNEYMIAEYYFDKFSVYGYFAPGSQPARYYYLWNRFGKPGPGYEKWLMEESNIIEPMSLESRLYDLAGVKYFYLPEHEWLFIDYRKSGQGEWIEVELSDEITVAGVGIYNTPDPKHRRIFRAEIVLNDEKKISIDVPNSAGWHRFYFEPIKLHKLKIIAKEVVPLGIYEGTRGVVIGEIELLDKDGRKVDAVIKNFNASSTLLVSNPNCIMDNRLGHVWESRCDVLADRTLSSKTLERLREGCYINKNVLLRAFMVHRYEYVKDKSELLEKLHSEDFEPGKVVLLEENPNKYNIQEGPYKDSVKITKYKLNSVEILIENDKLGFLVLSDMYAPGWEVYVNGKKEKLLLADGLFRGVYIEGGKNRVVFKYTPPLLKLGLAISFIGLIIIIGMVIRYKKRK